jgi:hypothetical protein
MAASPVLLPTKRPFGTEYERSGWGRCLGCLDGYPYVSEKCVCNSFPSIERMMDGILIWCINAPTGRYSPKPMILVVRCVMVCGKMFFVP